VYLIVTPAVEDETLAIAQFDKHAAARLRESLQRRGAKERDAHHVADDRFRAEFVFGQAGEQRVLFGRKPCGRVGRTSQPATAQPAAQGDRTAGQTRKFQEIALGEVNHDAHLWVV
jgi:hypothetical protein